MAGKANPRRYAQAVFEIAQEDNTPDKWQADLQQLSTAAADADFLAVMESPRLAEDAKASVLKNSLPDIGPLASNLAFLLISRNGFGMLAQVAAEYADMLNRQRGIETAEVVTAVPLEDADIEKLKTQLSAVTGAAIEVKTEVDPAILGGIVARVGGKLLDGSTRTKLVALKKQLESGGKLIK